MPRHAAHSCSPPSPGRPAAHPRVLPPPRPLARVRGWLLQRSPQHRRRADHRGNPHAATGPQPANIPGCRPVARSLLSRAPPQRPTIHAAPAGEAGGAPAGPVPGPLWRRSAPDSVRIEPTLEEYRHSLPRPVARARGRPQCRDIPPGEESSNGWGPAAVPGPRAGLCPSPRRAGRGEEIQPDPAGAGTPVRDRRQRILTPEWPRHTPAFPAAARAGG